MSVLRLDSSGAAIQGIGQSGIQAPRYFPPASDGGPILPGSIAYSGTTLYATDAALGAITGFSLSAPTLTPQRSLTDGDAHLSAPAAIVAGNAGNLYVADAGSGNLIELTPAALASGGTSALLIATNLSDPGAVALDSTGRVWVADTGRNALELFDPHSKPPAAPVARVSGSNTQLSRPIALALDTHGNLYVANEGSHQITSYLAGASGNITPRSVVEMGQSHPVALAADPAGRIYVLTREATLWSMADEEDQGATRLTMVANLGGQGIIARAMALEPAAAPTPSH